MLDSLNGQAVGEYRLLVEDLRRTRFFDQLDFTLSLLDRHANKFEIFRGLYNAGRPSIFVPSWIDGEFIENAPGNARQAGALYGAIAQRIGALIPPGGRLWFAYEAFGAEGAMMRETRIGLGARIPLLTTPVGFLLLRAGCWSGLRDWHFPEGGREGPRKLQGNKAPDAAHARERAAEIAQELGSFLGSAALDEIEQRAQIRAKTILSWLKFTRKL